MKQWNFLLLQIETFYEMDVSENSFSKVVTDLFFQWNPLKMRAYVHSIPMEAENKINVNKEIQPSVIGLSGSNTVWFDLSKSNYNRNINIHNRFLQK